MLTITDWMHRPARNRFLARKSPQMVVGWPGGYRPRVPKAQEELLLSQSLATTSSIVLGPVE